MGARKTAFACALALLGALAPAGAAGAQEGDFSPNVKLLSSTPLSEEAADVAFWGDRAAVSLIGSGDANDGFALFDISNPKAPQLLSEFRCSTTHFDISLWDDLVILADNYQHATPGCEEAGQSFGDGYAGIRLVSVADERKPRLIANVDSGCTGAHTHTLIPDLKNNRLIVWVNNGGGPQIYNPADAASCDGIVEIPLDDPSKAKKIADRPLGSALTTCHDVTVHLERKLAAASCMGDLRMLDISDPAAPTLISAIPILGTTIIHNASFSYDGRTLAISDEQLPGQLGAGGLSGCFGDLISRVGALYFYDVSNPVLPVERSHVQLPRSASGYCTSHQHNVVPLPGGRNVLVGAWYERGLSVIDFTNAGAPKEIGYAAPAGAEYWSAYWYNGHAWATSFGKGSLDVFTIEDPAVKDAIRITRLDAQTNEPLSSITAKLALTASTRGKLKARRKGAVRVTVVRTDGLSSYPAAGALVTAGKAKARANANGIASLKLRPSKRGTLRAKVTLPGYPALTLRLKVR